MRIAAALLAMASAVTSASAQGGNQRDAPPSEERLLNRPIPDIALTTATGAHVTVTQIARGRPLVLGFVFTRCAGVCSPFLTSWQAADRALDRKAPYARLVISFDPRDSRTDMLTFAEHHSLRDSDQWTFAVADQDDVRGLAATVGFWWDWDEARQQFDHPAMLAGIRDGRLVRLLVGGSITSARLDELVREVTGEFVRSYPLPGRVAFRCVQYDAATGRVTLDWGFALLLIPILATTTGTFVMFAAGHRARGGPSRRLPLRR